MWLLRYGSGSGEVVPCCSKIMEASFVSGEDCKSSRQGFCRISVLIPVYKMRTQDLVRSYRGIDSLAKNSSGTTRELRCNKILLIGDYRLS